MPAHIGRYGRGRPPYSCVIKSMDAEKRPPWPFVVPKGGSATAATEHPAEEGEKPRSVRGRPKGARGVRNKTEGMRILDAIEAYQSERLGGKTHAAAVSAAADAVGAPDVYVKEMLAKFHPGGKNRLVIRVDAGPPPPPQPGLKFGPTHCVSLGPRPDYENHRDTRKATAFKRRKAGLPD